MDNTIIYNKLESLRHCIQRIQKKTPPTLEGLIGDLDLQDIISVNLERAIQVCVDIAGHIIADSELSPPTTMAESFERLAALKILSEEITTRMKKAIGFRNIAVHAYQAIDWAIVYRIITKHLDDFSHFSRCVYENTLL